MGDARALVAAKLTIDMVTRIFESSVVHFFLKKVKYLSIVTTVCE